MTDRDSAVPRGTALTLSVAALIVNAFVWGLSWWPLRHLDALGLHSLWATAIVYALSSLALALWRPGSPRLLVRTPGLWALALASGLTNAAFNWAVSIGEVVRVVLLFYLMPVWAALFARWLLQEPITAGTISRAATAIAGAGAVLWQPGMGLPWPASAGDWLGVAGGVAFAMVNVLLRRQAQIEPGARALAMAVGGLAVPTLCGAALMAQQIIPGLPEPSFQWILPALALAAAMLVANLMLQYGAARLPSRITVIVMLSEVVFASVSAVWMGGESLTPGMVTGGLLIVLASAWAARPEPKASRP